jgi:hypothetical protein
VRAGQTSGRIEGGVVRPAPSAVMRPAPSAGASGGRGWPSENLVLTCQIHLARVANFCCASASLG